MGKGAQQHALVDVGNKPSNKKANKCTPATTAAESKEVNAAPAAVRRRGSWGAVIVDALDPPSLAFV